jgi:hypothetical protein
MRSIRTFLSVAVAAGLALTALASPASAEQAPAAPTKHLQRGMSVVRFDAKVAAANGYKIVTYADGSQQSVPVDPTDTTKEASPIVPAGGVSANVNQNTVYGNCGYSFIEADQTGPHKIWIRSGFHVNRGAVAYTWVIELWDDNGSSYQGSSGGLLNRQDWSHTWNNLTQYGYSLEEVLPGSSDAVLNNGSVCTSGGPWILWFVYA